jgi:hypothetical protein
MQMEKFKTAQRFLASCYDREFFYAHRESEEETREAKIQRSERAERNAVRALLSAIGLTSTPIGDDEDLEQAILRIQQTPEAQNDRAQHFLKGAEKWLRQSRLIILSTTFTGTTVTSTP